MVAMLGVLLAATMVVSMVAKMAVSLAKKMATQKAAAMGHLLEEQKVALKDPRTVLLRAAWMEQQTDYYSVESMVLMSVGKKAV